MHSDLSSIRQRNQRGDAASMPQQTTLGPATGAARRLRVEGPLSESDQLFRLLLTARTSSSTLALPSPSSARQALILADPSAMFTDRISSSIVTCPSPLQSPIRGPVCRG